MSLSPSFSPAPRPVLWAAGFLVLASVSCTRLVVNRVGSALRSDGSVFAAEDDPELVREAIPFGLKTLESLLEASPEHDGLLLAASSGFAQYAYAFVLQDAQMLEEAQPAAAREKTDRARKLFRRAAEYGFRGLEARHRGFRGRFAQDPSGALSGMGRGDVPLLYWTGASLALQISVSKDDMALVGRLKEVEALLARAMAVDEAWNDGALHEFHLAYAGGKGDAEATAHFERVLALTKRQKLAPLLSWAEGPCVQKQDRKAFLALVDEVLAFDVDQAPKYRLVNLVTQRRARWLKTRLDDLFLEE